MSQLYRYYVGKDGPQLFRSKDGELPFRVERLPNDSYNSTGTIKDVALNFRSGVAGSGGNIEGTITAGDYATYRAVHFNSFNIGGDLI